MRFFTPDKEEQFKQLITNEYHCTDVIGEKLGGKILSFSDEWFASAENLIKPNTPIRDSTRFTHAGAWYDGWETRRHNEEPYDWVIIKMGVNAAQIVGGEIDTAFFNGNHAPFVSVEGLFDETSNNHQQKHIEESDSRWKNVIDKFECGPSKRHFFLREDGLTKSSFTHIKLKMYPDGGIARFRLYGRVVPPSNTNSGTNDSIDLASVRNGGVALKVSDQHFGSADNLLLPGRGHDMSDGWETKRSREANHSDWAIIQLGRISNHIDKIIIDTAHYRGNFPQYITIHGLDRDNDQWIELVSKSRTGPDAIHEYPVAKDINIEHVKLTIIPDGGVKRIRVIGN